MAYNPNNPNGQATSANSAPVVLASDQSAVPISDNGGSLTVDGSVTVSGTVTANAGTGTFNTSDANAVGQSSATAAQKGYLSLAGATATLPTYTAGNTNAMTMTTSGLLRVDGSNVTQPVSGTITANAGTGAAPHNFGLTIVHKDGEYTTAQTTTALWTPTAGKKFAVTDITISTGGTTSGIVTVFDSAAATAYSAGTTPAIFRGEFSPSATAKPGAVKSFNVPYVSTTVNNRLHVTTSAAMTIYIQVNGYEI